MKHGKPLRKDFLFSDAPALGPLWTQLWELENELGERLLDHPIGAMVIAEDEAWLLRDLGDELVIVHGNWADGKLSDETSRYDFDLDWSDVDEDGLNEGIRRIHHALHHFETLLHAA